MAVQLMHRKGGSRGGQACRANQPKEKRTLNGNKGNKGGSLLVDPITGVPGSREIRGTSAVPGTQEEKEQGRTVARNTKK